ncbi:serine/threonine-protein phosphatase 1 regulatory subunit 10-like [Raphanus sativus]|nr:serine/threonine-protein phosphatase 1 regulatory subunit 10-like [Raphanus sativus]
MDRYERVAKPKDETPIAENEIRITSMGRPRNCITYAMALLQEKGSDEVIFKAMGKAINKSVTIAELIKRRIPGLHQHASIGSIDITDTWEPKEEGLLPIETKRHVSVITITLSKKELNTSAVGYQCPIPVELVKPFAEIDYEGRGDGYVNVEYDDEGMEPERVSGRGGRGGRGRGGFNRPPPYYKAQQDGGDYGRNGPPPQHHGYDDGGMEPERPSGRGRGGGRRGGRGRGGFNGPPPYYEAQQDGGNYGHNGGPPRDHEYDDGGMEPERPSGRGRGGGRRGTRGGRGRGGLNGPPPYYEPQNDGRDYGYDAPHQGRGGGRGRGGRGRGGGRGGFNKSNGPPIQAAAEVIV